MTEEDINSLNTKFDTLKNQLIEREHKLASRGVLAGSTRLKAAALQVQQVYASKLAEELAKGSKHAQRKATIAAELEALKLYINQWFALIDRDFKAGR